MEEPMKRIVPILALSLAVMHMGGSEDPVRRRAWRHALGVGVVARRLAAAACAPSVGEAFVAGLLHDLGRTLLMEVRGTEAIASLDSENLPAREHLREEQARFGCEHASLGAACLESWQLPEGLCAAVRTHHDPMAILAIADMMSQHVAAVVWAANEVENGTAAHRTAANLAAHLAASGLPNLVRITEAVITEIQTALEEEMEQLAGLSSSGRAAVEVRAEPRRRAWG